MPNRTPDVEISQCVKIILPWQLARLIGRNRGRQSDKILNSLESWYGTIGCYRVLEKLELCRGRIVHVSWHTLNNSDWLKLH